MDDQLVSVQNSQVVVSSRDIAEHFEKEHKHVFESIKKLIENQPAENSTRSINTWFYETTYIDKKGEQRLSREIKNYMRHMETQYDILLSLAGDKVC